MLPRTVTLELGETKYRLRWDMHAIATFEKLAGVDVMQGFEVTMSNVLDFVWSAIDADAASRDADAPVSRRRFGTLIQTDEVQKLIDTVSTLLGYNMPEPKPGKAAARKSSRAKRSRSKSSTNGARSTSASPNASSGV